MKSIIQFATTTTLFFTVLATLAICIVCPPMVCVVISLIGGLAFIGGFAFVVTKRVS